MPPKRVIDTLEELERTLGELLESDDPDYIDKLLDESFDELQDDENYQDFNFPVEED